MADAIKANIVGLEHLAESAIRLSEVSSKTLQQICNNKLFDIARFSYKGTFKPSANTIKDKMNAACRKYPDRTVAEMITIMKMHSKNIQHFDLKNEAEKTTKIKASHRGYAASGWIEAMKELGTSIGMKGFSVNATSKNIG